MAIGNPPKPDCIEKRQPRFDEDGFEIMMAGTRCDVIHQINQIYLGQVKPIFEQKCLICHGQVKRLPLYAAIPPSSFLVKRDIREARKNMDMGFDFPFVGHGTSKDNLKALQRVVQKDEMPPIQYRIMHWSSELTVKEKMAVLKWVEQSLLEINR